MAISHIGVIGNLTIDELERDSVRILRPGGSALFSSFAAASLGADVSIISNIGTDYSQKVLSAIRQKEIDSTWIRRSGDYTTRFRISYSRDTRTLILVHSGEKLGDNMIPGSFDAIHLGPVFGEIGLNVLTRARQRCKFLSVDVQGLLRITDANSRVRLARKNIDPFIEKCNLLKATEQEVRILAPAKTLLASAKELLRKGPEHILVTRGRIGSFIVTKDGDSFHLPSVRSGRAVDPTGAGDIFVGGWITTFLSVRDSLWSGAVGTAIASLSVQRTGLAKFRFSRTELLQRASWVYNHSRIIDS